MDATVITNAKKAIERKERARVVALTPDVCIPRHVLAVMTGEELRAALGIRTRHMNAADVETEEALDNAARAA